MSDLIWKCPVCGYPNGTQRDKCADCEAIKPDLNVPQDPQYPPRLTCPKCKSPDIHATSKGFGLGKAAVGGVLLGPVGLLGGLVGSKKIRLTCLACGYTWNQSQN